MVSLFYSVVAFLSFPSAHCFVENHSFLFHQAATTVLSWSSSSSSSLNSKSAKNNGDLFDSEGWKNVIRKDLDRIPIFTVATEQGNPLAYTIQLQGGGEKKEEYEVPCFYCDVQAALKELQESKENNPNREAAKGFDIVPFPLGQAFQLWAKDQAIIVPSQESVLQAGAPPGTNPIGQQVPLFACLDIAEEQEDGSPPRVPVFMALEDCNAAIQAAVEADGGNADDFEVACLSLSGVVDQLASSSSVTDTPGFHFIPASKSMNYIQEYLS